MANELDIQKRMREHLERQITWIDDSLNTIRKMDLRSLAPTVPSNQTLDEDLMNALSDWQQDIEESTHIFKIEYKSLIRAWRSDKKISELDRQSMQDLVDLANQRIAELSKVCLEVSICMGNRSARMKEGLATLERGRGMLNKYRVYKEEDASFIDKKA